jgi:hypothetical protein
MIPQRSGSVSNQPQELYPITFLFLTSQGEDVAAGKMVSARPRSGRNVSILRGWDQLSRFKRRNPSVTLLPAGDSLVRRFSPPRVRWPPGRSPHAWVGLPGPPEASSRGGRRWADLGRLEGPAPFSDGECALQSGMSPPVEARQVSVITGLIERHALCNDVTRRPDVDGSPPPCCRPGVFYFVPPTCDARDHAGFILELVNDPSSIDRIGNRNVHEEACGAGASRRRGWV